MDVIEDRHLRTPSTAAPGFGADAVGMYLHQVGGRRLLDRDGEQRLGHAVRAGLEARRRLTGPELTPDTRRRLQDTATAGQAAEASFVEANLRLVVSVARRYQHRGVEMADLIQEGNIGLMQAVQRFDPDLGFRFSTYATWWIRQALTRAIANAGSTVRMPVHAREKLTALRSAEDRLRARLGRGPHLEEVAEACGMAVEEAGLLLSAGQRSVSLSASVGEDAAELGELVAADDPSPEQIVTDRVQGRDLDRLVDGLSPPEALVIRLRYGLDGQAPRTLAEVAAIVGVSRERARQLQSRALSRLRRRPEVSAVA